jgi:hypothetical protein
MLRAIRIRPHVHTNTAPLVYSSHQHAATRCCVRMLSSQQPTSASSSSVSSSIRIALTQSTHTSRTWWETSSKDGNRSKGDTWIVTGSHAAGAGGAWAVERVASASSTSSPASSASSSVSSFLETLTRAATERGNALIAYLLPAGYPNTVAPSYASYATWSSAAMVFSSAGGGESLLRVTLR